MTYMTLFTHFIFQYKKEKLWKHIKLRLVSFHEEVASVLLCPRLMSFFTYQIVPCPRSYDGHMYEP